MAKAWGHWSIRWGKDKRRAKSHSTAFTPLSNTTHCETFHISTHRILIILSPKFTSKVRSMIRDLEPCLNIWIEWCNLGGLQWVNPAKLLLCFWTLFPVFVFVDVFVFLEKSEGQAAEFSLAARLNSGHWAHSPTSTLAPVYPAPLYLHWYLYLYRVFLWLSPP